MKPRKNGTTQRGPKLNPVQGEGPNWVLIVGGALLSTLSVKLGCKLKQVFDGKHLDNAPDAFKAKRRPGACLLHANMYRVTQNDDNCYYCLSGMPEGGVEMKQESSSPSSKEGDPSLPLVAVTEVDINKENGDAMWPSSPDRLELPSKPFNHSSSSDSPCVSEFGSDIFSKREVIHKLRQQLKRRDEMIMEMQAQIDDLQNSLSCQVAHSTQLQSHFDSVNQELFDSELEIQRLRKAIANHCLAEVCSPKKPTSWHADTNGHTNGHIDGGNDFELHCVSVENGRDGDRVEMLKREVGELKEVISGKEFLLQSYKEQKVELCTKLEELQLRLASHVPNIL